MRRGEGRRAGLGVSQSACRSAERRVRVACLTRWGGSRDSDMQGRPVDEFLDVAVERPALDPLEVEVGRTLEERVQRGLARAVVEELGALLAPIPAPVAARGAEAVEAGKDVECVGSGHDALLECG